MSVFDRFRRFFVNPGKRGHHKGWHSDAFIAKNGSLVSRRNKKFANFSISTALQEAIKGAVEARLFEFNNSLAMILVRSEEKTTIHVIDHKVKNEVYLSAWVATQQGDIFTLRVDHWDTNIGRPSLAKDLIDLVDALAETPIAGHNLRITPGSDLDSALVILDGINSIEANPPSIFKETISLEAMRNGNLQTKKADSTNIVLDRFLPLKHFRHVAFSSRPEEGICTIFMGYNKLVQFIYDVSTDKIFGREDPIEAGIDARDLARITAWWLVIRCLLQSANSADVTIGVMLQENHIAHYVWNELSVVDDLLKRGRKIEIYTTPQCTEPVALIEDVFPELSGHVTRHVSGSSTILMATISGNVAFLPFASQRVSRSLSERIAIAAQKLEPQYYQWLMQKRRTTTIIQIGLRVENRTWIRQVEGYKALIKLLGTVTDRSFVVVFDGHNYLPGKSDQFVSSLCENQTGHEGLPPTIREEKHMVAAILSFRSENDIKNVEIIDDIPCSMSRSLSAALAAHFVITYFGAGLTKYKWVANAPTLILSSNKTLSDKFDLRIFDTDEFREGVSPAEFYPAEEITDVGLETNLVNIPFVSHYRSDFDLDPLRFAEHALRRILQI